MNSRQLILVAEDDPEVRSYLEMAIRCQGYAVELAEDGEEALACLQSGNGGVRLVILDLIMPRKDGLETLREIRKSHQDLPVIMLSGISSPLRVVESIKNGATDFLAKPVSHEDLGNAIRKSLRMYPALSALASKPPHDGDTEDFLPATIADNMEAFLNQVGMSDEPVLLVGETGAGKEVLARQIHAHSKRANKPFLKLNCAALPSELVESELFGYDRGAFTGAFKNKPGKFEAADRGTILLDEIGDMDFKLQAKLLHVLQDHEFERLGGKDVVKVDVRVLAATHCDLHKAMQEGRFREDLYYRLNVITIRVPPLRERRDEILPLAEFLLRKHDRSNAPLPAMTPSLRQALLRYDWPGNVRELENAMRRLLVFRDPETAAADLQYRTLTGSAPASRTISVRSTAAPHMPAFTESNGNGNGEPGAEAFLPSLHPAPPSRGDAADLVAIPEGAVFPSTSAVGRGSVMSEEALEIPFETAISADVPILEKVNEANRRAEARAILAALNGTRWNRKQAAMLLKIDYKALLYKMRKLGIQDKPAEVTLPADQSAKKRAPAM